MQRLAQRGRERPEEEPREADRGRESLEGARESQDVRGQHGLGEILRDAWSGQERPSERPKAADRGHKREPEAARGARKGQRGREKKGQAEGC